jgi:uncharacterized membrane protein
MHMTRREHRNVRAIAELEKRALAQRSWGERLGDAVARYTGTMPFVVFHVVWFAAWILLNVGLIDGLEPFDPFPFSFLTLVVSLEAIFLSLFVLISQNRMTRHADKRAHLDLQINLLAEGESTYTLEILTKVAERLGVEIPPRQEVEELASETDIERLAETVEEIPDGS